MKYVGYYNGEIGPLEEMKIPMLDRAVYFGDGCYDATTFAHNHIFAVKDHVDRFYNSCKMLEIPFDMPKETLVEELQSAEAIEADIDNDVNYFLVVLGGKNIGYFACKMENTALHLMHLYLKPEYRGKAIGRDIVLSCERLARGEGKGRMWCTVHALSLIHI